MIAVTFALPSESHDFRRLLAAGNHEVAILHTGVGEKISRDRVGPFLDQHSFAFLLSSGFAGGIDPSLGVSDLFLANNFSDPQLLARAEEILIAHTGKLSTARDVVATAEDREKLARAEGAEAVDMETAWIAEACAARNLPMLSVRAISDTAAAPFPAPPSVLFDLTRQKTNAAKLGSYLLRHPPGVVRLLRFARQIKAARASLTSALAVLARELRP
jgi:adenosylhomocysteine nucleosidase